MLKSFFKYKFYMQEHWAQESIIYLYIGPVAQAKDQELSQEEQSLAEETVLVNEEVGFGHNGLGGFFEDECLLG